MAGFSEKQSAINVETGQGFDFELEVAGLGSRAYAFIIDWHIRILVALLWGLGSWLIIYLFSLEAPWLLFFCVLPATAIYVLYHPILEVCMEGNTPGKRYAKVRVVTQSGDVPGTGEILVRNLLRILDSMPVFYVVGIVTCVFTKEQRRIGDIAAGTLLIYDKLDDGLLEEVDYYLQDSRLTIEQQRTIKILLNRWDELEDAKRVTLGRTLLSKLSSPTPYSIGSEWDGTDDSDSGSSDSDSSDIDSSEVKSKLERLVSAGRANG